MKKNLIDERIVSNHKTYDGKPTIRNTRVAAEHILGTWFCSVEDS
jgi:uncharacterized protein (DUF433 family)